MRLKDYTQEELLQFIQIGFCQPKFYLPTVWRKANRVMQKLVQMNVGVIKKKKRFWKGQREIL